MNAYACSILYSHAECAASVERRTRTLVCAECDFALFNSRQRVSRVNQRTPITPTCALSINSHKCNAQIMHDCVRDAASATWHLSHKNLNVIGRIHATQQLEQHMLRQCSSCVHVHCESALRDIAESCMYVCRALRLRLRLRMRVSVAVRQHFSVRQLTHMHPDCKATHDVEASVVQCYSVHVRV